MKKISLNSYFPRVLVKDWKSPVPILLTRFMTRLKLYNSVYTVHTIGTHDTCTHKIITIVIATRPNYRIRIDSHSSLTLYTRVLVKEEGLYAYTLHACIIIHVCLYNIYEKIIFSYLCCFRIWKLSRSFEIKQ